jgi:6-phosphogluconolactonase
MTQQLNEELLVYVGTYTRGENEGIYVYRLDPSSGALTLASTVRGINNPSFLALHPQHRYLYSVSEVGGEAGRPTGGVSAFAIDPPTGALTGLNQQSSQGTGPCHLSVDQTGQYVLVANYGSGSVALLPIREDGQLGEATDFIQHEGSSVDPGRQERPHAHSITLDPTNRFAFAADLGLDKILIYQLDLSRGKLIPHEEPWVAVTAGAGPRHLAFHPDGRYAYVINELDNTLIAFAYDEARGTLRTLQTLSTLPEDFQGPSYCADVHVAPSGRFIYGSNRGHDSIAIFAVDEAAGRLSLVDLEPTQGKFPRNFALDPTGTFLLAANQDSDNIVTFRIDPETGQLTPTGHVTNVPKPVCVKMIPLPS